MIESKTNPVIITGKETEKAPLKPVVLDVTNNPYLLENANQLVASAYQRLTDPEKGITQSDVYQMLCQDEYEQIGKSRTLVAFAENKHGDIQLAGTVRLVFGRDIIQPATFTTPIEAMDLFDVSEGWPHRMKGESDDRIAELSRFVIHDDFRTFEMAKAGSLVSLTKDLFLKAKYLSTSKGAPSLYAVMPSYVSKILDRAQVPFSEVKGSKISNSDKVKFLKEHFPAYWVKSDPRLYSF